MARSDGTPPASARLRVIGAIINRFLVATPLLYVLRNDLNLQGPRFGCGLGQCGACTVIIKGEAVRSCIRPVSTVAGAEITTLEGLSRGGALHPVQQAWIDEQVPACGYC